jgi:signal peptidase I
MAELSRWGEQLQRKTERFLTWRKRRRLAKKERQKQKNVILDWLEAIGSAVLIVLLINQFLLQAYQIPSQSMVSTLEIGDRIFVNKLIYGPELVPGMMKLPSPRKPRRAEIVIFENPSYIPIGPVKDILQRVIYMVTLSLVDIDRDEFGNPKHHFLIKRAVGMPGDRLRLVEGNVEFLLPGQSEWIAEEKLKDVLGLDYEIRRIFNPQEYVYFERAGIGLALLDSGLKPSEAQEEAISRYFWTTESESGSVSWRQQSLIDNVAVEKWRYKTLYALKPYSHLFHSQWRMLERGWYVPEDRIFPMGDNRDDSRDARYFGSVRMEKVLGRALFRYWPLTRLGAIR